MRQTFVFIATVAFILSIGASSAWCEGKPDFMDSDAVLGNMRTMLDQCSASKAKSCMTSCGYGIKTLKNFVRLNPEGDQSIMKQRWQPCYEAHRDADIKAPATVAVNKEAPAAKKKTASSTSYDRSKFVISKLQLGGSMNSQKDRFFNLEAYGYHKKNKAEFADSVKSSSGTRPGPDIVKNYKGMINEKPVYIHFEADAKGRLYMIQFNQKERMDVDPVKDSLVQRYGKPSKHHGNYLYWGCERGPQEGFCVKANVTENNLEIWAFDEDIKKMAKNTYDDKLLAEQGVKPGAKF